MAASATHAPSHSRWVKLSIAVAALLMLLDLARLAILPQSYQEAFMDGFESVIVLLCAVGCGFAATRSSQVGKGLWRTTALYFLLTAAGDFHDFLVDISLGTGGLASLVEFLGWFSYLLLALLIFFPGEKDGRTDWNWLPFLDFLQVTLAVGLAYFQFIYLPHFLARQPWTVLGHAELSRNLLISGGLLLRAAIDPSSQARGFYRRVGGIFASVTVLRGVFPGYLNPIFALGRPALWLALGILAVRWEGVPDLKQEQNGRSAALRLSLSLLAAATLLVVVVLALRAPAPDRWVMYLVAGVSGALFILRSFLAEHSRHAAETQLRKSEHDYRILFESAIVPIVIFEPESERILQANAAACELYGVASGNLVGACLKDFTKDVARSEEQVAELLRTGTCRRFETVHRTRDGKEIDVLVSSSVVQYRGRRAILSFNRNITERKRAEEALRESETRFRTLIEKAPAAVGISREGVTIYSNQKYVKMFGFQDADDLVGRSIGEQWAPDCRAEILERARLRALGLAVPSSYEATGLRKDGSLFPVHVEVTTVNLPDGPASLAFLTDLTALKRAQETLVKLSKAVESSGEAIFMTDREGMITFVNPEFTRLYGYIAEEMVGKVTPRVLKSGSLTQGEYANFWKTILGKQIANRDLTNKTKDGRLVNVESSVNPILDERGEISGFLAIQRDITGRKQLEEQFRQAQKMEAVGRLAGGVAHDFNNLLTVINGYSQLIAERVGPQDPIQGLVAEVAKAGSSAAALTRQLLAFSRKQVFSPQILDLNLHLEGMRKMLDRLIGEDTQIFFKPGDRLGRVRAGPAQIEQVVMNLAINARDAMPKGGKLTIETARAELGEEYVRSYPYVTPGEYVMLAISDTGSGMDSETLAHIFEPFFTTKEKGRGTGLGLSTVYGIVKQSGGHVNVYSEVGHGTTFKIYLPRIEGPVARGTVEVEKPVSLAGTETILLVEDEPAVRALAKEILERNGYTVLLAGEYLEALGRAAQYAGTIHLLLTDVIMPGLNGRELADSLQGLRPDMKVLFISGYTADAIAQHGILEEGVAFLPKPFSPIQVLNKVREVLDKRLDRVPRAHKSNEEKLK